MTEHIDYWIEDLNGGGVAVFYRNADTEKNLVPGSARWGWGAVENAKEWALRNGCGEVAYTPGGPDD